MKGPYVFLSPANDINVALVINVNVGNYFLKTVYYSKVTA